ncbi:replication initiator [Streptomyces phytohabitans]|uniref:replication initiator n=1 Tax=Streptomyces phytohabitans TaxID=1150371 RepID=UPI00345C0A97
MQDLLRLARLGGFERVTAQVARVRGCTRPIQLTGYSATLDAETGEALNVFTSLDEPTGRLLVPCGNRRVSRCPACSRLYAADTFHLIRAGLCGGKGTPESVRAHPRVFATLTAPSYGPVHNQPDKGSAGVCRCGTRHRDDDPMLGSPLWPDAYDYTGAVLWNAHASTLWARFTTYLRREVADVLGLTLRQLRAVLRISFAKVAEYQKRGLIHFHAVIRFDGPEGSDQPPPVEATGDVLVTAIRRARHRVRLVVGSDSIGEYELRWGKEIDVREIGAFGKGSPLDDEAVAAYVAKYATKGAETAVGSAFDRPLACPTCRGSGQNGKAGCTTCDGTGANGDLPRSGMTGHARQMIRTAWDLGALPELAHLKLRKWAHMLGFRGHFSTKSRRYSTTLGALRDARRDWRTAQGRVREGLADHDETMLVLDSSWTFLGTGYTPGEELLAATVREQRALALQLKHEGGASE